jgi:hypothetical protein
MKSRRELVTNYCERIRSGEIEYSNLRKILEANNHSNEEIDVIIQGLIEIFKEWQLSIPKGLKGNKCFTVEL